MYRIEARSRKFDAGDKLRYSDLMSPSSYKQVKLNTAEVIKRISQLAASDFNFVIGEYAKKRMTQRNLVLIDLVNVLLSASKYVYPGEEKDGSYRYKVETNKIGVVVSFNDLGTKIVIVTCWRKD